LELYVDLNRDSLNSKINFMGRSNGYKIRLEHRLGEYQCEEAEYQFQTTIPWQMLSTLMLLMKEFEQAELYIDKTKRLLLHIQDDKQENSKFLRIYLQADLKVK